MQSVKRIFQNPLISFFFAFVVASVYYFEIYILERAQFGFLMLSVITLFACSLHLIYISKLKLSYLFALGLIFRLIFLLAIPNLSQDFYRFIWDGRMLFGGDNPFLSTPMQFLKEGKYPVNDALELFNGMGNLNAKHYTNYPPVSQLCYWLASIFGSESILISVIFLRLQIIAADIGTYFVGKKILAILKLPQRQILLYFLNPFIIIELTGNLHFEAVMVFLLVLSVYFLLQKKHILAAVAFALSVSTKLTPLLFLPVFVLFFYEKPLSLDFFKSKALLKYVFFCILVFVTVLLTFLPFVDIEFYNNYASSVGLWFQNFEFNASIYYVIRWLGYKIVGWNIIGTVGKVLPIVVFVVVILFSLFRNNFKPRVLMETMLFSYVVYLLLATTVHPWYLSIPLALAVFTKYKFMLVWSCTMFLSYASYKVTGFDENLYLVFIEYVLVLLVFLFEVKGKKLSSLFLNKKTASI